LDRLAAMQTFARVVETGSFSAAARILGVGQPAVSKQVAQLEARLGVRLLMRSTRGLAPTEAGLNFYERAKRAVDEADEAETAARGAGAGLTGHLRVSAAVTFARLHVVPYLPQFLGDHPHLTMEIVMDDRLIDLLEDGIDVALRMGQLADSGLSARKLAASPRRVIGAAAYLDRRGEPGAPAELSEHEVVVYNQPSGGETWSFRRDPSEVSVRVTGRLRVSAAEGVREAVLAGMGLAVASEWMFAPELAAGAVRAVLTDWALPPIDLWAVFPSGRMPTAKARAFAAFIGARLHT
jgi:DNA-binding transcriptional LysR family regulator